MSAKNTSAKQKSIQTKARAKQPHKHTRLWRWIGGILGAILLVVIIIYIAFQVSPWPSALLIRYEFTKGGMQMSQALEKHVPSTVSQVENQQYRPNDSDAYLDVFYPENTNKTLPTVVWVHGGAWIAGNKDEVDNYLKIVAAEGYTVVSINYSIAPEHQYPTPIFQVNDALSYLQQNAERLHIDRNKIALAGDSAGSQIVAQVATIITNSSYAKEMNITPSLSADKLKAMLLNCGAYDLSLPDYNGEDGKFLQTVLWAYSGTKDFLHDPKISQASVIDYVKSNFPPSFITAGNADPLENQSKEFAKKLVDLGVPTSTLFYPEDHQPQLQHEYQFNLDINDGRQALEQMNVFLKNHLQ